MGGECQASPCRHGAGLFRPEPEPEAVIAHAWHTQRVQNLKPKTWSGPPGEVLSCAATPPSSSAALPPLQSRVRALTEMQAPLEELRELVEEAEGLPVAMPEVERIQVGSQGCWAGRADVTRASQGVCGRQGKVGVDAGERAGRAGQGRWAMLVASRLAGWHAPCRWHAKTCAPRSPFAGRCTPSQMARPHPGKLAPPPLCRR